MYVSPWIAAVVGRIVRAMGLDSFAVVAASILGSSGVAGLLSGGIELGRRNRLRRSLFKTTELASKLPRGTSRTAVEGVRDLEAARYLALTLVGLPRIVIGYVFSFVCIVLTAFGLVGIWVFAYPGSVLSSENAKDKRAAVSTATESQLQQLSLAFISVAAVSFVILFALAIAATTHANRAYFIQLILGGASVEAAQEKMRLRDPSIGQIFGGTLPWVKARFRTWRAARGASPKPRSR
ncbi:hypothetical protein VH571_07280 [Frondihabitans sp. 4ASC-45]|uniref:hypothetical protein n=1 Tax=Frondihabitans sp. 4ASC-45 TaxID=3111636 RepID=UPI003C159F52